jgi:hypothetical protein
MIGLPDASVKYGKRASTTGPLSRTNEGTVFVAPCAVASATSGFVAGLLPPTAGCE